MRDKIMIIGGYGAVGRIISEQLCTLYPNNIIITGRRLDKAQTLARKLSNKAIPYQFDVNNWHNDAMMQQARLVVMCIDSPSTDFVKYCIEQGIHYIDITPTSALIKQFEALDTQAQDSNVSIVLSVGIAPGITNLLAQHALNQRPDLTNIDLYILFGLGEKHGDAGYKWVFENMTNSYPLASKEKNETITSLSLPKRTQLLGKRTFYSFNFADQHSLLRTTNARQVITRLSFDSKAATRLLYLLHRLNLLKPLIKRIQKLMLQMEKYGQMGSDAYAIKAVCWSGNDSYECSVIGNKEVDLTAYVATEIAKLVYEQPINRGIIHINEVVKDIPVFLANLKKYDGNMEFKS